MVFLDLIHMPYLNYMFLQLQIAVAKLIACRCYAKAELCCRELEKEGNFFLWVVVIKQLIPFGSYNFVKSTKIILMDSTGSYR